MRRTERLGDVAEIDADAVPDGAGAAHAIDEDVVDGEMSCSFGVVLFPAFETGFSGSVIGALGYGEEWLFWDAPGFDRRRGLIDGCFFQGLFAKALVAEAFAELIGKRFFCC